MKTILALSLSLFTLALISCGGTRPAQVPVPSNPGLQQPAGYGTPPGYSAGYGGYYPSK